MGVGYWKQRIFCFIALSCTFLLLKYCLMFLIKLFVVGLTQFCPTPTRGSSMMLELIIVMMMKLTKT